MGFLDFQEIFRGAECVSNFAIVQETPKKRVYFSFNLAIYTKHSTLFIKSLCKKKVVTLILLIFLLNYNEKTYEKLK